MADTIRQRIVNEVIARMQTILTVNEYETNAGQNVDEWKEYPTDPEEFPCIVVRDRECGITADGDCHNNELMIEFGLQASSAVELRKIAGDINIAIGKDVNWNGLAYHTEPEAEDIQMEEERTVIGDVSFRIIIKFKTGLWDPYTTVN